MTALLVIDRLIKHFDVGKHLKRDFGMSCLFVSHDLNVVRLLCDGMRVMYPGKIVEAGAVTVWFNGTKVQDGARFGEPKSAFHPFRFGNTPYLDAIRDQQKKTMTGPVFLQDHGNPMRFRNIWIRPLPETDRN